MKSCRTIKSIEYKQDAVVAFRLNHIQVKALNAIAKKFFAKPMPNTRATSSIAEIVLSIALLHPEQIREWWHCFCNYRDAEGVDGRDLLNARMSEIRDYRKARSTFVEYHA
jgi:hypothetical protein